MRAAVTRSRRRRAPRRRAPAPARPGRALPLVGRPRRRSGCSSPLTLGAELVVRALHVAPYVFPPPSAVLAELAAEPMLFVRAALVTVSEAAAGLVLGAALALAFAAAATHSRRLDAAAHAARRRVADGAGHRAGPSARAVDGLRLAAQGGRLCADRLLPHGGHGSRGTPRDRSAAAPADALRGRAPPGRLLAGAHALRAALSRRRRSAPASPSAWSAPWSPSGPGPTAASATWCSPPTPAWPPRRRSPPSSSSPPRAARLRRRGAARAAALLVDPRPERILVNVIAPHRKNARAAALSRPRSQDLPRRSIAGAAAARRRGRRLAGCGGSADAATSPASAAATRPPDVTEVTLIMDWVPWVLDIPVDVAQEKGFYADHGLKVKQTLPAGRHRRRQVRRHRQGAVRPVLRARHAHGRGRGRAAALGGEPHEPRARRHGHGPGRAREDAGGPGGDDRRRGHDPLDARLVRRRCCKAGGVDPGAVKVADPGFDLVAAAPRRQVRLGRRDRVRRARPGRRRRDRSSTTSTSATGARPTTRSSTC